MEKKLTELDIINKRKSYYAFSEEPVLDEVKEKLTSMVDGYNKFEETLDFRLEFDSRVQLKKNSKFNNVNNVLYLASKKSPFSEEKCGFFGELFLLHLVKFKLYGSFITIDAPLEILHKKLGLDQNSHLYGIVIFGSLPLKQLFFEQPIDKPMPKLPVDKIIKVNTLAPEWFMFGAYAVSLAPSFKNRQPIRLSYLQFKFRMFVDKGFDKYSLLELGAAKANFTFMTKIDLELGNKCGIKEVGSETVKKRIWILRIKDFFCKPKSPFVPRRELERQKYSREHQINDKFLEDNSYLKDGKENE